MNRLVAYLASGLGVLMLVGLVGEMSAHAQKPRVIADFEQYQPGDIADQWVRVNSKDDIKSVQEELDAGEQFEIQKEDGNQFLRMATKGEYIRFSKRNGTEFEWNLKEYPRLRWRWRALTLPKGASEKGDNDTGASIYVTFGTDWLGRPKSIKYTYSSSLPVGTTVSFGALKVIVVSSARAPGLGKWKTIQRRIPDDYRQVFGGEPPDRPVSITVSGDSDTTGDESKVDIDDIELLPPIR